ncbi:hypothetical protein D187_007042 [Cystobacter fuscus DSM 2262]|uniref:Uncharacterized protein n=1 Tax=Cystobacter fuscus (strain ATCC 25194 / DSM 2262 / NBRC 100088 / M29) TaxID=1242864 RepID=S9QLC3_CYSF2|nr:hypothetical protein [Cystobacter fuscus]EPX57288.1 hypothetical protein D187_007042 [Cystobacter fuscus DSM 2262]
MKAKQGLMVLGVVLSAGSALAVPKTMTEALPQENRVLLKLAETDQGKNALKFILSLGTYQDHADPTKFYYSPTFRVSPNPAGAATVVANDSAIARRSEIDTISKEISLLSTEEFMAIRRAYSVLTAKLQDPKLTQQERDTINAARTKLAAELEALKNRAQNNEGELPAYVLDAKYGRMADLFGLSGFPLSSADVKDVSVRTKQLGDLSQSNGGIFSGNVYSGFTPEEIEYLKFYKQVRADLGLYQVSLVKLPIQSISYFSLAETMTGSNDQQRIGVPLFRSMKGSGDGSSGTYNFDLTLDGAEKFSSAPPPIVVPVGLKAQLTVRPPALRASLSCDFTTGWSVQGRTDIKDGLIIFNDDIYTSMVAKSVSETNKPCRVHVEGGDGSAAQLVYAQALVALQERFTNLYFERVSLSYNEKLTYWDKVQQDIAAHRHQGANDGWSSLFGSARTLGYIGTIVGAFSNAARFYWHTNTQNIQHLNTVKFEQEIVIDQNKQINVELGTADMCLAWNPGLKRYLACTASEWTTSQPVEDAYSEARDSYLCDENDTTPECAEHRNQDAPLDDQGNIESENPPPPPPEVSLPDEI